MVTRLFFFLLLTAAPARAQSQYAASGRLRGTYEDVTIRTMGGRVRTMFSGQDYSLDLRGPLGLPEIGDFTASGSFFNGKNLSQIINGGSASQKLLGYSLGANLLPQETREFLSLGGTLNRNRNHTAWGGGPPRDLVDTSYGGSAGLTLPGLPSLNLSYRNLQRRDSAEGGPASQNAATWRESAAYARGPLSWDYQHTREKIVDLGAGGRNSGNDDLSANLSLDYPNLTRVRGLKSLALRTSFLRQALYGGSWRTVRQSINQSAYLTTARLKRRGVESYLGYGGTFNRISGESEPRSSHDLSLFSRLTPSAWSANNQVRYVRTSVPGTGGSQGVEENFNVESPRLKKYFVYRAQGSESVRWGGAGAGAAGDSLLHRLSFYPDPKLDLYHQQSYSGSGAKIGHAREGGFGLAAGLNWRPSVLLETSANYETQLRRGGGRPRTDNLTFTYKTFPLENLTLGGSYSLQYSWTDRPLPAKSRSDIFTTDLAYSPLEGLSVNANLQRTSRRQTGDSRGEVNAMDYFLSAQYQLGLISLALIYENREIAASNKYNRFFAELARSF